MSRAAKKATFLLSWKELAEADDFLTNNILDNTYYWIQSRKVQGTPPPSLHISQDMVLKLLRRYVIDALKPQAQKCVSLLMEHQVTKRFLARYNGDETKKAGFTLLCRRYVESYLPDCWFEIATTDRFGRFYGLEGCVVARRVIEAGAEIKYLTGSLAPLAEKEEDELKTELSILTIASLKETCLMLGPCRFINHSCEANAKFAKSANGIKICAKKKILPGEEITIEYASNYFGKRNRNCLCAACERNQIGFYHPERQRLQERHVEELSDSEDELTNELNATQPIVFDSEEEDELDQSQEEKSPSPLDDEEPEVNPARVKQVEVLNEESQRFPKSGLENLKMSMVRDAVMPSEEDTKVIGGRSLRKRDNRRVVVSHDASILDFYPLDDSLDSLALSDNPPDRDRTMQRQTMRTLHKLYMLELYKDTADFSQIYDCLNCGVYFKLMDTHKFKEYCPRCVRHCELFKLAWPDTIVLDVNNTKTLELDATKDREPIKSLIVKWGKFMKLEELRRAREESMEADYITTALHFRKSPSRRNGYKHKKKTRRSEKHNHHEPHSVTFSSNHKVFDEFSSSESASDDEGGDTDESDEDDVSNDSAEIGPEVSSDYDMDSSDGESSDGTPYLPDSRHAKARVSRAPTRSSPRSSKKRANDGPASTVKANVLKRARTTTITTHFASSASYVDPYKKSSFELAKFRGRDNIMSNDPSAPFEISDSSDTSDSDEDSTELLSSEPVPPKGGSFKSAPNDDAKNVPTVANQKPQLQSYPSSDIPSSPERLKSSVPTNPIGGSPITESDRSANVKAPLQTPHKKTSNTSNTSRNAVFRGSPLFGSDDDRDFFDLSPVKMSPLRKVNKIPTSPSKMTNGVSVGKTADATLRKKDDTPLKKKESTPLKKKDDTPLKEKEDTPLEKKVDTPLKTKGNTPLKTKENTPLKTKENTPLKTKADAPLETKDAPPLKKKKKKTNTTFSFSSSIRKSSSGIVGGWQSEIKRLEKKSSVNGIATKKKLPLEKSSISASSITVKARGDGTTQTSTRPSPTPSSPKITVKTSPRKEVPLPKPTLTAKPKKAAIQSTLPLNRKPLSLPKKQVATVDLTRDLAGSSAATAITLDDDVTTVFENGKEIVLVDLSD